MKIRPLLTGLLLVAAPIMAAQPKAAPTPVPPPVNHKMVSVSAQWPSSFGGTDNPLSINTVLSYSPAPSIDDVMILKTNKNTALNNIPLTVKNPSGDVSITATALNGTASVGSVLGSLNVLNFTPDKNFVGLAVVAIRVAALDASGQEIPGWSTITKFTIDVVNPTGAALFASPALVAPDISVTCAFGGTVQLDFSQVINMTGFTSFIQQLGTVEGGSVSQFPNGSVTFPLASPITVTPTVGNDDQVQFIYVVTTVRGGTAAGKVTVKIQDPSVKNSLYVDDTSGAALSSNPAYGASVLNFDATSISNGAHTFFVVAQSQNGASGKDQGNVSVNNPPNATLNKPADKQFVGPFRIPVEAIIDQPTAQSVSLIDPLNGSTLTPLTKQSDGSYRVEFNNGDIGYDMSPSAFVERAYNYMVYAIGQDGKKGRTAIVHVKLDRTPPAAHLLVENRAATSLPFYISSLNTNSPVTVSADASDSTSANPDPDLGGMASGVKSMDVDLYSGKTFITNLRRIDGPASVDIPWNSNPQVDGNYTISLKAIDVASNTTTVIWPNVIIDRSPPLVQMPVFTTPLSGKVSIAPIVSDTNGVKSVSVSIDNGFPIVLTAAPFTYDWDTTGLSNDYHTITITATDVPGNVSKPQTIKAKTTNPGMPDTRGTYFIQPQDGTFVFGTPNIIPGVRDNTTSVDYSISNGDLKATAANAPFNYQWDTTLAYKNTVAFNVPIHIIANGSGGSDQIFVNVDNIPPSVGNVSPDKDLTNVTGAVRLSMAGSDETSLARLEIRVNGVTVALADNFQQNAGTLGYELDTTAPQFANTSNISVEFLAFDSAGDKSSVSRKLALGNGIPSAPQFRIVAPSENDYLSLSRDLEIEMTGGDNPSSVTFHVDNADKSKSADFPAIQRQDNPKRWFYSWATATGLYPDGPYTITYSASNGVNDPTVQLRHVTLVNHAPTISINSPTEGQRIWRGATIQFTAVGSANTPLNNVAVYINGQPYKTDTTNPANHVYTIPFDTQEVNTTTFLPKYPDGPYTLKVVATDQANNSATSDTRSFAIDNAHPDSSKGLIHESPPDNSMPVTDADNQIFATFENASPDLTKIGPNSLALSIKDENGVYLPVTGTGMSITFENGTLRLNGVTIPPNTEAKCILNTQDMAGNFLSKTWTFRRPVAAKAGGIIRKKDLTLAIPSGALARDEFIIFDDATGTPAGEPDLNSPEINKGQTTVFGPKNIYGIDASQTIQYIDLNSPVTLSFSEVVPPSESDKVLTIQTLDTAKNIWKSLSLKTSGANSLDTGGTTTKSVSATLSSLGIIRVAAEDQPATGITKFFNFPNPFSPDQGGTSFSYSLGDNSDVKIIIYDLLGNLVKIIEAPSGTVGGRFSGNILPWDGKNGAGNVIASGGYIVHIFATDSHGNKYRAKTKTAVVR